MFIGRFYVPRWISVAVAAGIAAILAAGAFLFVTRSSAPSSAEPPRPAPTSAAAQQSGAASGSPSLSPDSSAASSTTSSSAEPSGQDSGSPASSASGTPQSSEEAELVAQYDAASEFQPSIGLNDSEPTDETLFALAVEFWQQTLLLAQTNERPGRIVDTDLDIIGARVSGATWDGEGNKLTVKAGETTLTVYLCLPNGPSQSACEEETP